ncbi:PEP-CTERM sorting domain-containing protein [Nostocaceae cyanobacterium CENA369]|uniref:PEP-CTERM sorting domain-containing protein n=1 Tax=Dendronalium phyllosphericum CENA369 TaxID=1725256 RepID=A0A8J7I5N7_9NOST|nr:PEP-CTERM sorting domain-containing protein [Dendronalium phyllosphericum]MBH8573920.1 PEP-CTERM sorting domain-containing protein [Dendronalium phyllosphericum CENA369]
MRKHCKLAISAAIVSFGLGVTSSAQASSITLSTSDSQLTEGYNNQGWWNTYTSNFDYNSNDNDNYLTGKLSKTVYRSFFTFDVSVLKNRPISSATLKIQRFQGSGYSTHTLGLFDVSTPAIALNQKVNNPDLSIYDDLGSGKSYGNFKVTSFGDKNEVLNFSLNSNAIADINAKDEKYFSIGAALLGDLKPAYQYLFAYSADTPVKLVVTTASVPEPLTLGGTVVAGAMGWWIKRKRQAR